ncbi:MAG: GntR family transcriptional regulator [Burkholderiales bacterium]|nr:MAG: GntR family transcriptional regulator [Burkholderiales bacterium]
MQSVRDSAATTTASSHRKQAGRAPVVPTFSPLYRQIKALITRSLRDGDWKPGEAIPSEQMLARRYGVSQGTVRKAIDELAAEHLLVRRQGRGTFVASHNEARAQFRFLRLRPDEGEPAQPESRILECRRLRAPAEIARLLRTRPGETAVLIRRLLAFANTPTVLDEIWLAGGRFRGLTAERLSAYRGPMYGLFEAEFGTRMIRCEERIRAVAADGSVADALDVPLGHPLLLVDRLSYTYNDVAVEVRRGYCVTSGFHFFNELL